MGYIDEVKNYLKIDKTTLVELRGKCHSGRYRVLISFRRPWVEFTLNKKNLYLNLES